MASLAIVEFTAVIGRRIRVGLMTEADAVNTLRAAGQWRARFATHVEIDPADLRQAGSLLHRFELKLRTQDAIHIATAQRVAATLATFDEGMAIAARALGVSVIPA